MLVGPCTPCKFTVSLTANRDQAEGPQLQRPEAEQLWHREGKFLCLEAFLPGLARPIPRVFLQISSWKRRLYVLWLPPWPCCGGDAMSTIFPPKSQAFTGGQCREPQVASHHILRFAAVDGITAAQSTHCWTSCWFWPARERGSPNYAVSEAATGRYQWGWQSGNSKGLTRLHWFAHWAVHCTLCTAY